MKPMLFNGDMVRALLEGQKTVTRRIIKPLCQVDVPAGARFFVSPHSGMIYWDGIDKQLLVSGKPVVAPYLPGDILYVRETWWKLLGHYLYRADLNPNMKNTGKWRPSIHMPREAARIFLRVTDVRVERLQDITPADIRAEGIRYYIEEPVRSWLQLAGLWDSTIRPADLALYGWDANPWVWVVEFKRISREEAYA